MVGRCLIVVAGRGRVGCWWVACTVAVAGWRDADCRLQSPGAGWGFEWRERSTRLVAVACIPGLELYRARK